jgi:hypothetical protein
VSKRRKAGDWVWLAPMSGFCGESNRLRVEILNEGPDDFSCVLCGDEDCREWPTVLTEPDPKNAGKRHTLYHVSECEMFDEHQTDRKGMT